MTGSSFLVKKCQETTYDLLNRSVSRCEEASRHSPCKQLRVLWAALFRWVRPSLGHSIGLSNAQITGGPSRTPLPDKIGSRLRDNAERSRLSDQALCTRSGLALGGSVPVPFKLTHVRDDDENFVCLGHGLSPPSNARQWASHVATRFSIDHLHAPYHTVPHGSALMGRVYACDFDAAHRRVYCPARRLADPHASRCPRRLGHPCPKKWDRAGHLFAASRAVSVQARRNWTDVLCPLSSPERRRGVALFGTAGASRRKGMYS
jgi:hypothetical protein